MTNHNPFEFATSLAAKLATRSRHVCFFVGAGAGKACGLPDVAELCGLVRKKLPNAEGDLFDKQIKGRTLEQVLSRLRRISSLIEGAEKVDGLTAADATMLDKQICKSVVSTLEVSAAKLEPMTNLAAWVARANYHSPVELFTVNYDLLLETALEAQGIPYFDGFVGNLNARFRTDMVEAPPGSPEGVPTQFVRLWKLHGSVNWIRDGADVFRLGNPAGDSLVAAIYPSDTKYEESRRVPYIVLHDRLRQALNQPETLAIVTGYSFGDEHLNELLFDAAARRERSEFVVFCYATIPPEVASRAARTPNLQVATQGEAILGGIRRPWQVSISPPTDVWNDGRFCLGDFKSLSSYLARSSGRDLPPNLAPPSGPMLAQASDANAER